MSICTTNRSVPPGPKSHSVIAAAKHQVQTSADFDPRQEELEEDVRDSEC